MSSGSGRDVDDTSIFSFGFVFDTEVRGCCTDDSKGSYGVDFEHLTKGCVVGCMEHLVATTNRRRWGDELSANIDLLHLSPLRFLYSLCEASIIHNDVNLAKPLHRLLDQVFCKSISHYISHHLQRFATPLLDQIHNLLSSRAI